MEEKEYLELAWRGSRLLREWNGPQKVRVGSSMSRQRRPHSFKDSSSGGIPLPVMGLHRKSKHCPGEESALNSCQARVYQCQILLVTIKGELSWPSLFLICLPEIQMLENQKTVGRRAVSEKKGARNLPTLSSSLRVGGREELWIKFGVLSVSWE